MPTQQQFPPFFSLNSKVYLMKEKTIRKSGVLIVLLLLFASLFIALNSVQATSTETTGITGISTFNSNQAQHVIVGGFDIFATPNKILFYTDSGTDAVLAKSFTVTLTLTYGSQASCPQKTLIASYNSTAILVVTQQISTSGTNPVIVNYQYFYLNINTLITQNIATNSYTAYASWAYTDSYDFQLMTVNSITYTVGVFIGHGNSFAGQQIQIMEVLPSVTTVGSSTNANFWLAAPIIFVPSLTTNEGFLLGLASSSIGTNRFNVIKINFVTPTFTLLGSSGIDGTWGNYVYVYGSAQHTDGSSTWYDIGIVYNSPTVNQVIIPQICRFNDTSVDYIRSTLSATSGVNLLRCLSVAYDGIWDLTTLLDGAYEFFYVGASYGIMLCPFTVTGLSTNNPTLSIVNSPSVFGDNGLQWYHYYTTANSVGGILSNTGIVLMLDYQNGKAIATRWASLNPSYSYVFSLTPQPLQIISSGTVLRAVCWLSTQYTYNGEVFQNQIRAGNGTYTVSTTGLSTDYNIASSGTYGSTSTTGSIINGLLTFTIPARTSAYSSIYEGIKVTITINGASQDYVHLFVWTSNANEDGLPHTTPLPTPAPTNGGGGIGFGGGILSVYSLGGLIICLVFSLLFGVFAGKDGLLLGLTLGIAISSISGLFPVYFIIFAIITGVVLIVSHTGIPHGGGGTD